MSLARFLSRFAVIITVSWTAIFAATCAGAANAPVAPPLKVVVTIAPIHSLVAQAMKGAGMPRLLLHSAASPHTASLKPSDARALAEADLVVWVGPMLETPLARSIASLATHARVLQLSRVPGLTLLPLRAGGPWEVHDDHHDRDTAPVPESHAGMETDPHVWLDPGNAVAIVDAVAHAFAALDPSRKALYATNAAAARASIAVLDKTLAGRLAPVRKVPFIVFHDAYQYFDRHYGLTAVGSVTLGAARGTGARRLMELRTKIRDAGVACVFAEPQFEPRLVHTLIEGTAARAGVLDPLGADLNSGPGQYAALMRRLAGSLVDCLERR